VNMFETVVAALVIGLLAAPSARAGGERRIENECFLDSGMYRVIQRTWILSGTEWVLVSERTWLTFECPLPVIEE